MTKYTVRYVKDSPKYIVKYIKNSPKKSENGILHRTKREYYKEEKIFTNKNDAFNWLTDIKNEHIPDEIGDIELLKRLHLKTRCRVSVTVNFSRASYYKIHHWFIIEES